MFWMTSVYENYGIDSDFELRVFVGGISRDFR